MNQASPVASERHVPALDGVRGVAVLTVMVHHMTHILPESDVGKILVYASHFGHMGVDLFFVLSGFLITGILLESRENAHYFRNFYARRVLRIFPLYYLFLAVGFALLMLFNPDSSILAHGDQPWYWLYLQNFRMTSEGKWYSPFAHTWSLAIEEQFYFIWPLLVFLLPRRGLLGMCGVLIVGVPLLRVHLLESGWSWLSVYAFTFTRLDPLAMGAFAAIALRDDSLREALRRAALPLTLAAGSIFIMLAVFRYPEAWDTPLTFGFGQSAACLALCGLLISSVTAPADRWRVRFFELPVLRTLGKYSYALYILHVLVIQGVSTLLFTKWNIPQLAGSPLLGQIALYILAFPACLAAAWLSWQMFEKHFLSLKRHFPSANALAPGGVRLKRGE